MLKNFNERKVKGFTLIELMIVIAIIGILAAIAIPQFSAYRVRSYNATAEADLRNAITAQEAYYQDHVGYSNTTGPLMSTTYGLFLSDHVHFEINSGGIGGYAMLTFHNSGSQTYYVMNTGGVIEATHNVWDGTY